MKQIDVKSDAWINLLDEIQVTFNQGDLITHDWLRKKFGLEALDFKNFKSTKEFIEAYQTQQFAYMTLVDTLRWQLLEEYSIFIKNIRGDGYSLLPPEEQVQFGYDEFMSTIKTAIKRADLIMKYVQPVSMEQQSKDRDMRAKCSMLKMMLKGVRSQKFEDNT